ncbi:hypothetical protein ABPG72_015996 [Tetrahymena utriculariae]
MRELFIKYSQIVNNNKNKQNFQEELLKSIYPNLDHLAQSNDEQKRDKLMNKQQFKLLNLAEQNQIFGKSNIYKDSPISPESSRKNLMESQLQANTGTVRNKMKQIIDKNFKNRMIRQLSISQKKFIQSIINTDKQLDKNASKKLFTDSFQIDFISIKNMNLQIQTGLQMKKQILSKQDIKNFSTPESRLPIILKGLAAQYFVFCSPICSYIVQRLKEKAFQLYKQIDWQRAYVVYQPLIICENTYPNYAINCDCFKFAIQEIFNERQQQQQQQQQQQPQLITQKNETAQTQNNQSKQQLKHMVVYLRLIEGYLFCQAQGISNQTKRKFQVSQGDALHSKPFKMRSKKYFEKSQGFTCCHTFQEFLGINMVEKGLKENQRLPVWIQFDIKVLPQKKDVANDPQIGQVIKLNQSQNAELYTLVRDISPRLQLSSNQGQNQSHSDEILEEDMTSFKRYKSFDKKSNNKNLNTMNYKQEQNFNLKI